MVAIILVQLSVPVQVIDWITRHRCADGDAHLLSQCLHGGCIFMQMVGDAGLLQAAAKTLRPLLLSAQSETTGGFVTLPDSSPGICAF